MFVRCSDEESSTLSTDKNNLSCSNSECNGSEGNEIETETGSSHGSASDESADTRKSLLDLNASDHGKRQESTCNYSTWSQWSKCLLVYFNPNIRSRETTSMRNESKEK